MYVLIPQASLTLTEAEPTFPSLESEHGLGTAQTTGLMAEGT